MSDGGPEEAPPAAKAEEAPASPGKPRRRRKRRPSAPSEEGSSTPEQGLAVEVEEQVPAFARGWPRDPALDALVAAFEAGEYARVRREAPELAARTESDAVRRAARELRRRLDPDPVAVYMLMAAAALLVFLAGWYWLHPHTP